ncbi:hypothetical protein U0070_024667 [Myodes glareolus]|uniref:ERAP1-like C-terminal domain-containing protein n=1 Tax=Myodes glareolus TaxID=447135 RepID=A0AAW0JWI5_MYOGA
MPSVMPSRIPHPIQRVALCNGIALGSVKEWDFLFSFYVNITKKEEERGSRLIPAMCCSKEPWILNRFMAYVVTVNPNPFNKTNVIEAVAASEVGQYVAKDFLLNNWAAVWERYGPESVDALVWVIGRTVSTDLQVMELQWFLESVLEEHQKIAAHAKLQAIKTENLKNKERIARMTEWLWKNT